MSTQEEADALKALMHGINQAKFARDFKLPGGASMLSQHKTGKRPINMEHGLVYSKGLGVPLAAFSPRLARMAESAQGGLDTPPSEEGRGEVTHAVSHRTPIIALRSVTWEGLKVERFEEPFQMAIETDDLMPDVARGEIARFKPGATPRAGKAVLLKDSHGEFHLRLFEPGLGGDWAGYSKQPGVKRLERFKDGMELMAPMTGHDWE